MDNKEATEEFLKHETCTELDAVHPRFMSPQDAEVIRQYEIQHHYYCDQCRQFFSPSVKALQTHFRTPIKPHEPYTSCVYCEGNVYEYKLNNERKFYHDCRDCKGSDSSSGEDDKND